MARDNPARCTAASRGGAEMDFSTYASGYKRLYKTDEAELRACLGENRAARGGGLPTGDPTNPDHFWWPATIDFQTEAERHKPAFPVADFSGMLATIRRNKNVKDVYWFGHGASGEPQFGAGKKLSAADLDGLTGQDLSSLFVPKGGRITSFACNTGKPQD